MSSLCYRCENENSYDCYFCLGKGAMNYFSQQTSIVTGILNLIKKLMWYESSLHNMSYARDIFESNALYILVVVKCFFMTSQVYFLLCLRNCPSRHLPAQSKQ